MRKGGGRNKEKAVRDVTPAPNWISNYAQTPKIVLCKATKCCCLKSVHALKMGPQLNTSAHEAAMLRNTKIQNKISALVAPNSQLAKNATYSTQLPKTKWQVPGWPKILYTLLPLLVPSYHLPIPLLLLSHTFSFPHFLSFLLLSHYPLLYVHSISLFISSPPSS